MGDPFVTYHPPTLAKARLLFARGQLYAALEYGFALLDALDLPEVELDAIDKIIANLDAIDAPEEDLEPYLAGSLASGEGQIDAEREDENDEDDGTAEDDGCDEETSLETGGRGFVRCGADDAEDEVDAEDDELGDELPTVPVEWMFGPKRTGEAERQNFAARLAAAEVHHG